MLSSPDQIHRTEYPSIAILMMRTYAIWGRKKMIWFFFMFPIIVRPCVRCPGTREPETPPGYLGFACHYCTRSALVQVYVSSQLLVHTPVPTHYRCPVALAQLRGVLSRIC